ncbi:MAG: hypothetical protein C5B51_30995 [Terriglobia bacterium]|nr:MAG: hypothetical protein C5B51_30995 [Terriglobia bacterium]
MPQLWTALSGVRRGADRRPNEKPSVAAGSIALLVLVVIPLARPLHAADLQPDTLSAWDTYVTKADIAAQEQRLMAK